MYCIDILTTFVGEIILFFRQLDGEAGSPTAAPEAIGINSNCLYFFLVFATGSLNRTGSDLTDDF